MEYFSQQYERKGYVSFLAASFFLVFYLVFFFASGRMSHDAVAFIFYYFFPFPFFLLCVDVFYPPVDW